MPFVSSWVSCSTFPCLVLAVPDKTWASLLHICDCRTSPGRVRASSLSSVGSELGSLLLPVAGAHFPFAHLCCPGGSWSPRSRLTTALLYWSSHTNTGCLYILQSAVINQRTFCPLSDLVRASFLHNYWPHLSVTQKWLRAGSSLCFRWETFCYLYCQSTRLIFHRICGGSRLLRFSLCNLSYLLFPGFSVVMDFCCV